MSDRISGGSLVLAFAAGAAFGAIAGVLLAPAPGRETRENVRNRLRERVGDLEPQRQAIEQAVRAGLECFERETRLAAASVDATGGGGGEQGIGTEEARVKS